MADDQQPKIKVKLCGTPEFFWLEEVDTGRRLDITVVEARWETRQYMDHWHVLTLECTRVPIDVKGREK